MKTKVIKVDSVVPDSEKIIECADVIRNGGLVIFPTETVYGIAADVANPQAMQRLREVKKRSDDKPFSVLISQEGLISNYTSLTDPALYKVIDAYWPGPLTVVVPSKKEGQTVGVRMPNHAVARKLVEVSQCTIAAPSANFEGTEPPRTCQEALRDLDGLVDIAIESDPSEIGRGSSVVDMTNKHPKILREGVISLDDINRVLHKKVILFVCTGNSCRSVMAEYMLRDMLGARDDVIIASAGANVFYPSGASAETISVLKEEGIDAISHISRPIDTMLLKRSDLVIVMTRSHRQQILERTPVVEQRVYLLKEFVELPTGLPDLLDIPDPIGQPHHAYQQCLGVIKESMHKVVDLL